MQDTPRTDPASFKISALLTRLKGPGKKAMYDLVISMAADGAKRVLTGA
jgi:hypothetical protein